jgi:micrococcal nuclease
MKNTIDGSARKIRKVGYIMKKSIVYCLVFAFLLTSAAFAESFEGQVISVLDGNNLVVAKDSKLLRVRLYGIDCPEIAQDFGPQAKQMVTDLTLGKKVWIDTKVVDHGKRIQAAVMVDNKDVALELVGAGMAWIAPKSFGNTKIDTAEKEVRAKQNGLWSMSNPTPAWQFRRQMWAVTPIMSKVAHNIGSGDFSTGTNNYTGYGFIQASCPPGGFPSNMGGGPSCTGPSTCGAPGTATTGCGGLQSGNGPGCSPPSSSGPACTR